MCLGGVQWLDEFNFLIKIMLLLLDPDKIGSIHVTYKE